MKKINLETIVVITCFLCCKYEGFVPPSKNANKNTLTEVKDYINNNNEFTFDAYLWELASEIIFFFKNLREYSEYDGVKNAPNFVQYESCIDLANKPETEEISALDFSFGVLMPHLYAKLKPSINAIHLNPAITEAKIYKPNEFLGKIGNPERFFMKLVKVEKENKTTGGNLFVLKDRSGNQAIFYDKAENWNDCIELGSCFHFHAIPHKHVEVDNIPITVLRNVEYIETAGISVGGLNKDDDKTKLFSKNL